MTRAQSNHIAADAAAVLHFWFGDTATRSASEVAAQQSPLWWSKNARADAEIRRRFAATVAAAGAGELDHWGESARGLLALIICTDQFPRNIFRDDRQAFAYDARALELASQCVGRGWAERLRPIERVFAYLPFEHSEELSVQRRSLALYESLAVRVGEAAEANQAAPADRKLFNDYVGFARRHHDIIARFGRFPHRNQILGRDTTAAERVFLTQPNSSF